MKNINKTTIVTVSITLVIGVSIGWLFFSNPSQKEHHHSSIETNEVWTCSMHPQIRKSEPGNCPICGMKLIPASRSSEKGDNSLSIRMSPTARQLANVQTSLVQKMLPKKSLHLNGKVQLDETQSTKIAAHFHGRIEKLYINYTGEKVQHGQLLAEVYSPELATAQQELHLAYQNKKTNPTLYKTARKKLVNWKIAQSEIDRLEKSEIPITTFKIHAHHKGIVTKKNVAEGDHVKMGDILLEVADLSNVWIQFDIYESDIPWVEVGNEIKYTVESLPGQQFEGKVSFVDPVINAKTRVAKARVSTINTLSQLKPEMFVSGTLERPLKDSSIVVPKTAVMWTGTKSVVYIKSEDEKGTSFIMREVTLGPSLGDSYIVIDGIEEGEEIATSGTFSIDAAAQLAGKPSMMNPDGNGVIKNHSH